MFMISVVMSNHVGGISYTPPYPLAFSVFLASLPQCSLYFRGGAIDVPSRTESSIVPDLSVL